MISPLKNLTAADRNTYGAKAATLGELIRSGIPVPDGFALSMEVFSEFLRFNQNPFHPGDNLSQNEAVIDFIMAGKFPTEITDTLHRHLHNLKGADEWPARAPFSFVVRSSALVEDLESHSMAGVFCSYINLNSYHQLELSIKKCYASLFSDRALSLMVRYHFSLEQLNMGIIIQKFIEGKPSGVAFTAEPVKMDPNITIINAVDSICADYVEGKLVSSIYQVSKKTHEILDSFLPATAPVLSESAIHLLYKTFTEVENILGDYQDIEWTLHNNNLYILQSRPITTFRHSNYPEGWFVPKNPQDTLNLFEDLPLAPMFQDLKSFWFEALFRGTEYSSKGRNGRYQICNGYFYWNWDERDWEKRAQFRTWLETLLQEGKNIFQDILLPELNTLRARMKIPLAEDFTPIELINLLDQAVQLYIRSAEMISPTADAGCVPLEWFENHCRDIDPNLSQNDFCDLVYQPSILCIEREAVINLALLVKSNPVVNSLFEKYLYDEILYAHLPKLPEGQLLLNAIEDYLKCYGSMTVNGKREYDTPVQSEEPWCVLTKIRSCLAIDTDLFFKTKKDAFTKKAAVFERLTAKLSPSEKEKFQIKLQGAEKAFVVNDDHCFYIHLTKFSLLHLTLVRIANLLTGHGILEKPDELYYLTFNELKATLSQIATANWTERANTGLNYQPLIQARKTEYRRQKRIIPPPYIGIQPPAHDSNISPELKENPIIIKGVSGLRKKVIGTVKVISGTNNIQVDEPKIFVMRDGHACYFLPFLHQIKGLIYDQGSPFDHPGIIAREMEIPSLYHTQNASQLLQDGDEIELDGINECVRIIKSSHIKNR
ncbi:MAG TPA: PEP/pyruvate-binding domain-containing protein [Bacillota bacterium]|nr:PEP/pyruvate-binding domain-containing protein [Bacillota bacterium]